MTGHDAAIYSEAERCEEQREIAREYGRLRDEEDTAASLVLSAAENLFINARSQDPDRPDPTVVFAELRTRTDAWVQARDTADAYQREHGQ